MRRLLIFILISFSLYAYSEPSFSSGIFHLWTDNTGSSFLSFNSIRLENKLAGRNVFLEAENVFIGSSLEYISADLNSFNINAGLYDRYFGLETYSAFFTADKTEVNIEYRFWNSGFNGVSGGLGIPVYFDGKGCESEFWIKPSVFMSNVSFSDGSFYWFYGKPDIPLILSGGVNFKFRNHCANLLYGDFSLDIVSNGNKRLVAAAGKFASVSYSYDKKISSTLRFQSDLALLYFGADFDGELNSSNQNYVFFPFKYFDVSGNIDLRCVLAGISFFVTKPSLNFNCNNYFVFVYEQDCTYSSQWKYKNSVFFNGSEGSDSDNIKPLDKALFWFCNLGLSYNIYSHNDIKAELSLSKLFFVPFNISQIPELHDDEDKSSSKGSSGSSIDTDLILSWLFSCMNLSVKISL